MAFYRAPPVTITVGALKKQAVFYVHENLLTQRSEYFKTCLQSSFQEGHQRECLLKEDNPDAFEIFVQWLYLGKYKASEAIKREDGGNEEAWYLLHAHAYVLGNKLVASAFKRTVVETFARLLEQYDSIPARLIVNMAEIVYGGTSDTDGFEMRKLLASYCASRIGVTPTPISASSDPRRPLSFDEVGVLAGCSESEFIRDVLCAVHPRQKLISKDILASLFPAMPAGGI
jgi:hypothetical protein